MLLKWPEKYNAIQEEKEARIEIILKTLNVHHYFYNQIVYIEKKILVNLQLKEERH